jgi:hypothetical protein
MGWSGSLPARTCLGGRAASDQENMQGLQAWLSRRRDQIQTPSLAIASRPARTLRHFLQAMTIEHRLISLRHLQINGMAELEWPH